MSSVYIMINDICLILEDIKLERKENKKIKERKEGIEGKKEWR